MRNSKLLFIALTVVGCEGSPDGTRPEEPAEVFEQQSKPVGDPSVIPYEPAPADNAIVIPADGR